MAQTKHRDDQLFAAPVEFDDTVQHNAPVTMDGGLAATGDVELRPADGTPILTKVPAPSTGTTSVDMLEADLLSGIHVKTPVAAQDFQLPTGAEISAAILAVLPNFAVGDSFDFSLVNLGGVGDIVTITTAASGTTVVGYMGIHPAADGATLGTSAGLFRVRNTGADTWTFHRIA